MTLRIFIFGCCALALSVAHAGEKLDVKTGQWEMTLITRTEGNLLPKATLDKLPPEQRAKLEKALAARAGSKAAPKITKTCMTEEDLEKGISGTEPNVECKKTVIAQTATHQELALTCSRSGLTSTGHMTVDALSQESVAGLMELSLGEGKVLADFSGKWIGPNCPADSDN